MMQQPRVPARLGAERRTGPCRDPPQIHPIDHSCQIWGLLSSSEDATSSTSDSVSWPAVVLGQRPLTIEDVHLVAEGLGVVELNTDLRYRAFLSRGHEVVRRHIANGGRIYGVNTGFGDRKSVV